VPDEHRRSLTDSLRHILDRGKGVPSNPQSGQADQPPQSESAAPPATLSALSLQELLRYAHVLAAAAVDASELHQAQAEVDRRLVDAQQDADIASLHDAARRLERRRLTLEAEQEDDRLLRPPRRHRRRDDDGPWGRAPCMCSVSSPPADEESQPLGR
jgi:hypothetical protein